MAKALAKPKAQAKSFASKKFLEQFDPYRPEGVTALELLTDERTGARYVECHIRASKIVTFGTTDVPLDPEEQAEYRANRQPVLNAPAFLQMKDDAKKKRSFSNIVAEYSTEYDKKHPLKIIGGQHRYQAIAEALKENIDQLHGVKVYFDLNINQRLDVQLISNTNIAISPDLLDRMQETTKGPELRAWCQKVGFLKPGEDFADKRVRSGTITVQLAKAFIINYLRGSEIDATKFAQTETTPYLPIAGGQDSEWDEIRNREPPIWDHVELDKAAREFANLIQAQRQAFAAKAQKSAVDYPEKAMNAAVLVGWAYVAGLLETNKERLKRHFALAKASGRDPLNAADLAKGRHKTDPENYRGLGYRTDTKERGRLVELFFLQAQNGSGITKNTIDIAIKQYHAKQAQLEVLKAIQKG